MRIKVDRSRHILYTIIIWSRYYKLTPLEERLTYSIILHYLTILDSVTDDKLVNLLFLSPEWKKEMMEKYGIPASQMSVYLSSLRKKGVLLNDRPADRFLPSSNVTFEFVYETGGNS